MKEERQHSHPPSGRDGGLIAMLRSIFHSHDHGHEAVDRELEASADGVRAVKLSLMVLALTALVQLAVVVVSGSVALLSDTLHNIGDALTAFPLWLAFRVGRRPRNRHYTHGYGRFEDLAGIFVVITIFVSAVIAGYESIDRLLNPQPLHLLAFVMVAAIAGFVGNELVAVYRIRVGRRIGSAALVADGLHARTDGFTSLAVLVGAVGVSFGWKLADPIVGLLITLGILFILKDAARDIYHRLMDAVDPQLVDEIARVLKAVTGVRAVGDIRVRWIGHALRAEVQLEVDGSLNVAAGHAIALEAHHALLHEVPRLTSAIVHVDSHSPDRREHHASIAHHFPDPRGEQGVEST